MSLGTSNRDGGKTSESGHLRALAKLVNGDVLSGLAVSQRAAGLNMSVDIAVGDAFVRRSDGSYAHPVFNDAVYNQVISTADGSNPRRDIVVIYVDYAETPSTAVSNNTNGVVKIKVVNGTPAGSPTDPNDAAIQSSVGSGNPWTKLARVRVPAGQTSISNSLIDDLRTFTTAKSASVPQSAIDYSGFTEAERIVGSLGGKPVYQKTINFGALPNATTKDVAHGISAITAVLSLFGAALESSGSTLPLPYITGSSYIALSISGSAPNKIRIVTPTDRSSYTTTYVTITYTKT
jgi:hypothetical protein